ncbi:MAG: sigma-70 family RNA polymerase sigma factor [Acidimicrobiales bacterium]
MEAARSGDPDAWEQLYRHIYPKLRSYVVSRVGVPDAEDLVSETMTRAVAAIDGFRLAEAGFDGWLFGIARRVTADHNRRAFRHRAMPVASLDRSSVQPEPDASFARDEEHAQLRAAMSRLRTEDQELLELRAAGRFSMEEIATILGKRPGAVRTAYSRALGRLRDNLSAELAGEDAGRV